MQTEHYLRGYETKIVELGSQLQQTKNERDQLANEHDRVKRLVLENQAEIQAKNKLLKTRNKEYEALRVSREETEAVLKGSQLHRKSMYDFLFARDGSEVNFVLEGNQGSRDFVLKMQQMKTEFANKRYEELQKIIQERNQEVKKISKMYGQLSRQHIKSTNQYQNKITILKEQNLILKKNQKLKAEIEEQIRKVKRSNCDETSLYSISLEQKLDLMVERLEINQELVQKLEAELEASRKRQAELNRKIQQMNQYRANNEMPDVQNYMQVVRQNDKLNREMAVANQKYEQLTKNYPAIAKNQSVILDILSKYRTVTDLQSQLQAKDIQINRKNTQCKLYKQQIQKLNSRLQTKVSQRDGSMRCYEAIIDKFNEFFKLVNPYFETYKYDQLGLDAQELQLLKKGKNPSQETHLRTEIIKLEQSVSDLNRELKVSREQVELMNKFVGKLNDKIRELENRNESIFKNFVTGQNQQNLIEQYNQKYIEQLLKNFTNIQQQRNKLKMDLHEKQLKIIELLAQISYFKQRDQSHLQNLAIESSFTPEISICQPSVVWVSVDKDLHQFQSRLQYLEKQLREIKQQNFFSLNQVAAQYSSTILQIKQKLVSAQAQLQSQPISNLNQPRSSLPSLPVQQQSAHEPNTIIDMDEQQLIDHQGIEEPLNTLSAESIHQMNKLLNGHETNLKNLITAYNELRKRVVGMEERKAVDSGEEHVTELRRELRLALEQLRVAKQRLAENNKSIVYIEEQIQRKTEELQLLRLEANQSRESNLKIIEELRADNEALRQQINQHNQSALQKVIYNKNVFPEEIEYLVQLASEKQKQIKSIVKSAKQRSNAQEPKVIEQCNLDSVEMIQEERRQLLEMVNSVGVVDIINAAIEKLRAQSQEQVNV